MMQMLDEDGPARADYGRESVIKVHSGVAFCDRVTLEVFAESDL